MPSQFTQDPQAVKDYTIDWGTWLPEGDTIAASSWTVDGPDDTFVKGTDAQVDTKTDTTTTVWLSGGTLDQRYQVTNHITTTQGRQEDHTLLFRIGQE